ncbi:MAG: hypothetical protein AAGA93_00165 [Actinomycetota bacterium]
MSWLKWLGGFVALVVMVYACALPGNLPVGRDGDDGLPGLYTVNGIDPVGGEYSGTLTIVETNDPRTFRVQWLVTGARQEGTGRLTGDVLTVTWTEVDNATGQGTGSTEYRIRDDGSMTGVWTADGFDSPGTEEVFPDQ